METNIKKSRKLREVIIAVAIIVIALCVFFVLQKRRADDAIPYTEHSILSVQNEYAAESLDDTAAMVSESLSRQSYEQREPLPSISYPALPAEQPPMQFQSDEFEPSWISLLTENERIAVERALTDYRRSGYINPGLPGNNPDLTYVESILVGAAISELNFKRREYGLDEYNYEMAFSTADEDGRTVWILEDGMMYRLNRGERIDYKNFQYDNIPLILNRDGVRIEPGERFIGQTYSRTDRFSYENIKTFLDDNR